MERLTHPRSERSPSTGHHPSTFGAEQACRLEPDPAGRAGNYTHAVAKLKVHGAGSVVGVTTTILLARHGETDWNRDRRFQGHADPPLNDLGRGQAADLARELARTPPAAIYSSDLRRAAETAAIVGGELALEPEARPELREIDVGEWSGLTMTEIEERYPEGVRRHREGGDGWAQGEPHEAMQERIVSAVLRIAAAHPDERVLLVIHGGTMRALLAAAENLDFAEYRRTHGGFENGSMVSISVENGALTRLD